MGTTDIVIPSRVTCGAAALSDWTLRVVWTGAVSAQPTMARTVRKATRRTRMATSRGLLRKTVARSNIPGGGAVALRRVRTVSYGGRMSSRGADLSRDDWAQVAL